MNIEERFTPSAVQDALHSIQEADGNEVFFIGRCNGKGFVETLETVARGDETSVPALEPFVENGDVVIHNHPSGVLKPSGPDLRIASSLGNRGIGFYIINNRVSKIYCVAEPARKKRLEQLDGKRLVSLIAPGGALSKIFPDYEGRNSQLEMLEAVAGSFNDSTILLSEAGTGVGKSIAYLVPSLAWAALNGERVVISTATINLQHQLTEKDIPLVQKLLKKPVKSVLVKGRGNYLCLRRFEEALEENALFRESGGDLEAIQKWIKSSETGSRSDLPFYPAREVWARVCSETDACMGLRCKFREGCFVLKARREAASASILVVNHHLLFSDLALRMDGAGFEGGAVLPAFTRLIFDEAHTIERSATSFFSRTYQLPSLHKQLSRLLRRQGRRTFGVLPGLQRMSDKPDLFKPLAESISKVRKASEELDKLGLELLDGKSSARFALLPEENRKGVVEKMTVLRSGISSLASRISYALESVTADEDDKDLFEAHTILDRLGNQLSILSAYQDWETRTESVFWIESKGSGESRFVSFIETPLDIGPLMQEAVYDPFPTLIFTSATMTVNGNFSFWMNRLGLFSGQEGLVTGIFPSPFKYREQVLLALPTDPPDPSSADFQGYVSDFVKDALLTTGGSALVLFTSYGMLNRTWEAVAPVLEEERITVLRQGSDDRSRLLLSFNSDVSSVLFATDSFWEGVDAPGEALRLVIICKLPFRVPTDPVLQARMEAIERKGGNSFFHLSLPEAAMRLKQGFGRLMRKAEDRGAVVILDPRIMRKSYGKILLSTLPETRLCSKESSMVLRDIENFLF